MKKQLLFSTAVLLAMSLTAQEAKPVVIVNATGKVELIPQHATIPMEIQSGSVAKSTGQLKLANKATAVVYCNGSFKKVKGNQTIALASICGTETGRRSLNFDFNFGNYLMAAIEMVAMAQKRGDGWSNAVSDPKKTGDGWGTAVSDPKKTGDGWGNAVSDPKKTGDGYGNAVSDPKKTGDGWGGKGSSITLILPFGKLVAAPTTFSWSKPAATNEYHLILLDSTNKTIHSITVRDTFVQVNLKALRLVVGNTYHWKVTTSGAKPMESSELEFVIGNKKEFKAALRDAGTSDLAKSSKGIVSRGLTEAIALESGHWLYAAQQKYAQLQQKQPDNLVRIMHAAFWMRYGFVRLAKQAAKG